MVLFMASAIMIVKINPLAPTSDPATINTLLSNNKPAKAAAIPDNEFSRESFKTNEVVYVVKGDIDCNLYTEEGDLIKTVNIKEQELIILFNEAHEYIMNKDSIIVEIKNGPYFGPEKDRVRIETR